MSPDYQEVEVAIIGAGSAGLSALRQVKQVTDSYLLIDGGPLGTTCARSGCMPSKALLHVANIYHMRHQFSEMGILGGSELTCNVQGALQYVRHVRDHFAGAMVAETVERAEEGHLIEARARFIAPQTLLARDRQIKARQIIIATGATPVVPKVWEPFRDWVLTTDTLFEQADLPRRIAVVGLGPVGLELGQALSRLGIEVVGVERSSLIGGIESKELNEKALELFGAEFPIYTGKEAGIVEEDDGLFFQTDHYGFHVDGILAAMGVKPNLSDLGLEHIGVELDEQGMPPFDPHTGRIADLPVYLAGDVNRCRPILHEAVDAGFLAGYHAVHDEPESFCRRVPMRLVFTDPQIAVVGQTDGAGDRMVSARTFFDDQSRAVLEGKNKGILKVYADRETGRIKGAEMVVPEAEHLAHLMAWAVQQRTTVWELLNMPFYHPTIEEGLRSAIRGLAGQIKALNHGNDLMHGTQCAPEKPLC
jgi:dihydrolipoamide dehydrogenase